VEATQGQPSGAGGNTNVDSVASQIESKLFASDTPEKEPQAAPEPTTSEAPQADAKEAEGKQETAPEAEGEKAQSEPEGSIEIDEDVPLFELKVKGEDGSDITKKVSLSELKKGHMMEADYRRKTAELARQREAQQLAAQTAVQEKVGEYEKQLSITRELLLQAAAPELKNVDWLSLASEDPARYVALKAKADALAQAVQNIDQQQRQLQTQRELALSQNEKAAIARANEELTRDIPGWGNDTYQAILRDSVEQYGFNPDEVGKVVDPRVIKMMRDAAAYRKLQSSKVDVAKKVVNLPKAIKPGVPAAKGETNSTDYKEAVKVLRKSGRLDRENTAIFEKFV
jgi:hypothetical protein